MRLALQTLLCCCVFTLLLPLVRGATGEKKKRFRVWPQSRVRRDLQEDLEAVREICQQVHAEATQEPEEPGAQSVQLDSRSRRSPMASSKSMGCVLVTCYYQDLLHRLQIFNDVRKEARAPGDKIGSGGYGRRRRSLPDSAQPGLRTGRRRRITGGRGHRTPPREA
ncbi:uncharacterized protein admb [Genypterus blacodes]|uniref:uncharacterized protein admb n=1 Tax=Genypterus blacodes TaxID=154954 RepID=UPI003F7722DA